MNRFIPLGYLLLTITGYCSAGAILYFWGAGDIQAERAAGCVLFCSMWIKAELQLWEAKPKRARGRR